MRCRAPARGLRDALREVTFALGAAACSLVVLAAGGCEAPADLALRYRAERMAWQAMKLHQAMRSNPELATPEMSAILADRYRAIVQEFPPPRQGDETLSDIERDLATISAQSRTRLALLALEEEDLDAAGRLYASIRDSYGFDRQAAIGAAIAFAGVRKAAGDWPGAVRAYEEIMKRWPPAEKREDPPDLGVLHAPIEIARGYLAAGDAASAAPWFERARAYERRWVSTWPNTPTAHAAMSLWAETFAMEERWADAAAAYEELDRLFGTQSNRAQIWLTLGDIYERRLSRTDVALDYYGRVARDYGDTTWGATAEVAIARREMAGGRGEAARARLAGVLERFRGDDAVAATALHDIATSYEIDRRWNDATREFEALADGYPTTMYGLSAPLHVADRLREMGEEEASAAALARAVEHYEHVVRDYRDTPAELAARNHLIEARQKQGNWSETASVLSETAKRFPDSGAAPAMLLQAAEIYETRLNDRAAAAAALEALRALAPGSPSAREAEERLRTLRG